MKGFRSFVLGGASAMSLLAVVPASATTYTIDFSTYPLYTPVSSGPDAAISLMGGYAYGGGVSPTTPVTGSFGTPTLGNSTTGEYPTQPIVQFAFTKPVDDVSFTFDNFGANGTSFFSASNGATGNIGGSAFAYTLGLVTVPGTLTNLQVNNGLGSERSWEYGIGEITYSTVPEPATWALMMGGFAGIGLLSYLRRHRPAPATA
jgi:hypothetical protein